MKRILSLILVLLLAFSLVACGSTDEPAAEDTAANTSQDNTSEDAAASTGVEDGVLTVGMTEPSPR